MCKSCKSRCLSVARIRLRGRTTTCKLYVLLYLTEYEAYRMHHVAFCTSLPCAHTPQLELDILHAGQPLTDSCTISLMANADMLRKRLAGRRIKQTDPLHKADT